VRQQEGVERDAEVPTRFHQGTSSSREVDDGELATVLASVFPRSAQLSAREVEYRTAEDEWVLSLRYSGAAIVGAITARGYTREIEEQIQQALAEALEATTAKIWRVPMFSLRHIDGWYRHNDDFLIRPAPEEAPRPSVLFAQHPWILEFSFRDSTIFMVRNLRIAQRRYELGLLLMSCSEGGSTGCRLAVAATGYTRDRLTERLGLVAVRGYRRVTPYQTSRS